MSTRKRILFIALIGLLVASLAGCAGEASAGGGPQPVASTSALGANTETTPRTVSVNGLGMASARPDVADIQLGVETIDADAGLAVNENTERMTAVMDAIKAMGVEDKDVQTVQYSMWIEQQYDKQGEPTGENRYHVVNQVRIRVRELDKVGQLLQKALEVGANTVNGVSFSVADPTALQEKARQLAIANAKTKADQLAAGLGAKLGALRQVSEFGGLVAPVAPVWQEGIGGGGPVPMSGGEFSVTVEIQVIFDLAE